MKKSLLKRAAAWAAAVAMLLSPAGADLAGITALAAENISVNDNSGNIGGDNNGDDDNGDNDSDNSNNDNDSDNSDNDSNNDNNDNDSNNNDNNDNSENNDDNNGNDSDNNDSSTDEGDNENTDGNNNDDENNDDNEEEEAEADDTELPYVEHYVSPISGEGLLPYEYYDLGEIEFEEGEEPESFIEAPSYNDNLSSYSSRDGYNALSAALQEVYNNAYSALVTIDSSAAYDAKATETSSGTQYYFDSMCISDTKLESDDIFKVFVALMDDNPQFFWLGHGYRYGTIGSKTYIYFGVDSYSSDCYDGDTRMEIKEKVMTEVEKVIDEASVYGNEYSKEWYIHNYLCEKTVYDLDAEHAHDISGILVSGRAVCESYAKCFQLFMNAFGIDVLYVVGTGNGGGHAWNQIGLDNGGVTEWYNVDVTWDDGSTSYDYNYFNVVDSSGDLYDFTKGYNGHNEHTPLPSSNREYLYPVNKCKSTTYSYTNHEANYEESGDAVAQVGSKTFYSLNAAIKSIRSSGQTIKLLADASYKGAAMPSYSLTIDGDGKYAVSFDTNMTLNADLTLKDIAGIDKSDFDYSSTVKNITVGAHSLTVSGISGDNSFIPVMICGSTTKNKGSVVISSSDVSIYSIENVENLTLEEGSSLTLDAGAFGTNLTLGKNAVITDSSYVLNKTYYSDPVNFAALKQSAGSVLKIDNFTGYNYFIFDSVNTSVGITLTVDNILDEEVLEDAPLAVKNKISVDDIILDGVTDFGALSRIRSGDGYYCYLLSSSYNYKISDGTNTSQRVTLDEILELISEKNNTKADYVISAVSEGAEGSFEGSMLNALKAKSVAFDKIPVRVTSDVTLKCALSFNSGAEFEGKVNAGAYKLTLGEGEYIFRNALTSTSAVSVSGGKMTLEGEANNKAVSHSVKELSLEKDGYVFVDGGSLKITSALSIAASKFSAINGARIEIASISSTGEVVINSYNEGTVTVTGNVTLTDSKPVILSSIDFTSDDQKNIVSSGQTAIIAKSKNVTADMFTTSAKTAGEVEVALEKIGNEIRFATSAFTCGGNNYSQWSGVLQYINSNPDSTKIFEVTLLDDAAIDELTLPAANKAGGVKLIGGKTITIKNKTLKVTVDLTLDEGTSIVMNSNKSCAVTVAAGKSVNGGKLLNAGKITGTATSAINAALDAVSISSFRNIEGSITVSGTVTGVTFNNATVNMLAGSNVTASTGNSAVEFRLDANGSVLPKLTFNSVGNDTSISVVDGEAYVAVASGTVVAYSSKQPANKIRMSNNKTSSEKELEAVYYSSEKAIRAEYTGAISLILANGEVGNFSGLELVFDEIKELNDKNARYVIRLNDDISASSFKLPTAADYIRFEGPEKSINLSNVTAVSLPVEVHFDGIKLESNKPFTMTASKDLILEYFTSDSLKQLKGGTKSSLELWGGEYSFPIAGFGKIILSYGSTLSPKSSVSFTELDIDYSGNLVINEGVNVTIKNISGSDLDHFFIDYSSALYTPFTVTGKVTADVVVGINGGKFNEGQLAFKAASADLSCFEIAKESKPEGEFTFSRDKSNVYVKGVNFELKLYSRESKMAEWSDVVSSISAANIKDADYTVTLLNNYKMYSTMTMPKKGTYNSITIDSVKSEDAEADEFRYKYFNFVGSSITLTGDTKFENIGVYGFKKSGKDYNVAYYKINAGKNALTLNNVDARIGGITSSGKLDLNDIAVFGNVTAGSAELHSVIFAGNTTVKDTLDISGENAFLGTFSVGGINAVDTDVYNAGILMVYGKKFSVGKSGVGKNELTIGFVNAKDYSDKTLKAGDKVCDITGDYYGNIKIDGQDGLNVVRSGNKLVCADTKKTSVYKLIANDTADELTYISLKDIMTDINRMNDPEAEYTVKICQNESIKGSLPVPSAKKYSKLAFVGENDAKITVTGDIKLTGDLDISGIDIKKVNNKGIEQVMNYTVGNYALTLGKVEEIGKITGAKGSVNINAEDGVEVTGSVNVASFTVDGDVVIGPKASFTASNVSCGKFTYNHSIASRIKIGTAEQMTLCILDASGKALEIGEAYAGKALMGQYKGNVSNIILENKIPDGYVLATGKSNMLTIGKVVCKAGEVGFASVRDAVNSADSEITLLEDITMTEVLTIPEGRAVTFGTTGKTLKLKGVTQVNGSLTFKGINVMDASSKLGLSFKLSGKGNLKFSGYKSNVNINAITTGKLEAGYGNIELNEAENVNFNGAVKCRAIIVDSTSKINFVKGKSLQLDECFNGTITLVDKNGKPVTIKQNDSVYKVTKPVDDVKTTLTNKDANGKSHKLVYSKGYIKVGEIAE